MRDPRREWISPLSHAPRSVVGSLCPNVDFHSHPLSNDARKGWKDVPSGSLSNCTRESYDPLSVLIVSS